MTSKDGKGITRNHTIRSQTLRSHRTNGIGSDWHQKCVTKTIVIPMDEITQVMREKKKKKEADRGSHQGREALPKATGKAPSQRQAREAARVQVWEMCGKCWQQHKREKRPTALFDSDSPIGEISSSAMEASSGVCPPPFSSMAALGTSGLPEEASWCVRQVRPASIWYVDDVK